MVVKLLASNFLLIYLFYIDSWFYRYSNRENVLGLFPNLLRKTATVQPYVGMYTF